MTYCEDCGGEGGFEVYAPTSKWAVDPVDCGWCECSSCGGSGWVDDDPPGLDMDDLEERCGE